jgi:hypothetical protein
MVNFNFYFYLKVKTRFVLPGFEFGKSELEQVGPPKPNPIGEENVGNKMMKQMGWRGGGLGRDEQGMKEPIE